MAVMVIALVWLGVYPQPVLDLTQPVIDSLFILASSASLDAGFDVAGLIP